MKHNEAQHIETQRSTTQHIETILLSALWRVLSIGIQVQITQGLVTLPAGLHCRQDTFLNMGMCCW